jgi:hypothetical protein
MRRTIQGERMIQIEDNGDPEGEGGCAWVVLGVLVLVIGVGVGVYFFAG